MEKEDRRDLRSSKTEKIEIKEENLNVKKKKIETGRVKISKKVLKDEVPYDLKGFVEDVEIKRKKIDRVVDSLGPAVRKEGNSTVYSLYREVYVKKLILQEEVWITKKKVHQSYKGKAELKKEVLDIERTPTRSPKKD
jgi:uncharacterized protein (TIGR02271 family)